MNSDQKAKKRFVDSQHPYLGLDSFTEEDRAFFSGRTSEIERLFNLVEDNSVTIFFGSSGLGKTSLLKAGLFPRLKKSFFYPVYIRLDFTDRSISPIEQTKHELFNQISIIDKDIIEAEDLCLWEYLHTIKIKDNLVKPVLVFDQFEEIFTVGRINLRQIEEFKSELIDLVENQVPISVQSKYENKEIPFTFQERDYRIIISLREDYLAKLETWNELMPSIQKSRFPVTAMNREQAFEAITNPGKDIIENHEANIILDRIITSTYGKEECSKEQYEFEPFLLSLICEKINNKRFRYNGEKTQIVHTKITEDVIETTKIKDIISEHYLENTAKEERKILEENLLTIDGYRNLQVLNDLYGKEGISTIQIKKLINNRIIRQTTRNKIDYIELIHDVLVPIVKENRDKRKKIEQEEINRAFIHEERRRQQHKLFLVITPLSIIAAIIALFLLKRATDAKAKADIQRAINLSESSRFFRVESKLDPTLSLRLAQAAYEVNSADPRVISNLLTTYYSFIFYKKIEIPEKEIISTEISHDHEFLFIQFFDKTHRLYRFSNNNLEEIPIDTKLNINHAAFSEKGKDIIFLGWDSMINVCAIKKDTVIKISNLKTNYLASYAEFSANGKLALFNCSDSTVRVWDWNQLKHPVNLKHDDDIVLVRFINDENWIFTSTREGKITIWDSGGKLTYQKTLDKDFIDKVEISVNGDHIITISKSGLAHLWSFNSGLMRKPILVNKPNEIILKAKFTPDGKSLLIVPESSESTMEFWAVIDVQDRNIMEANRFTTVIPNGNVKSKKKPIIFKDVPQAVGSIVFCNDGTKFITTSQNSSEAIIWDSQGNKSIYLLGHTAPINWALFPNDDKMVITMGSDNTIRIWQLEKTSETETPGKTDFFNAVTFEIDSNNTVKILDKGKKNKYKLFGHKNVNEALASENYDFFLTHSIDKSILWNKHGDSLLIINNGSSQNGGTENDFLQLAEMLKNIRSNVFNRRLLFIDIDEKSRSVLCTLTGNQIILFDYKHREKIAFSLSKRIEIKRAWFSKKEGYIGIEYENKKFKEVPIDPAIIHTFLIDTDNYIEELTSMDKTKYGIINNKKSNI